MLHQQIHNYKIISLLGEGGMANVYLAEHISLKGKVAIKLLKDEFVTNKNIRKRFLAEARILHQLSHVNIVKVTDLIDAGDIVAYVMEYIEGDSLSEFIIKKGKLTDTDIEYIFPQMLSAVAYIHEKGLIHRDIKPSNFMMTKDGNIKLLDFGIAKNTNEGQNEYTQTGTSHQMGTPLYMSPEQVQSTKEVTSQSDIYSLGVVLWQMVMNKKPYNAENLSLVEIQIKIFQEPLALTKTIWDPFIQKATKKKLEYRYINAKLFLKSFNDFLSDKKKKNKLDDTVFESQSTFGYIEASKFKRFLNFLIDFLFVLFLCEILILLIFPIDLIVYHIITLIESESYILFTLLIFLKFFIFPFFYYLIFEYFTGRTLAKFITNTKVITLGSKYISLKNDKPSFISIFKRSLWRFQPFDSFAFLSKHFKKGTHDSISKTIVINYKSPTLKKQITKKILSYVLLIGVIITWVSLSFSSEYISDTDKDGFKNKYDLCPEEYGSFNGCPDNDKDGVINSDDRCPDEYGEYNGCFVKKSLVLKNETDYVIWYAITYYDAEKDDYISMGHYSILPHENHENPFPENFIRDQVYIRATYFNNNGTEVIYVDDKYFKGEGLNFYYDSRNNFEEFDKNSTEKSKAYYYEFPIKDEFTEYVLK
jgi:serine/threonine protein kinase